MTAETEFSEVPPRERTLPPGIVRFVAMLAVAMCFGFFNRVTEDNSWPLWISYAPKVALALAVGVLMGVMQDKPATVEGEWRVLRWRIIWYQAISWSFTLVLFLTGTNAWKQDGGWQIYFIVAAVLISVGYASDRLKTKFRCPHCDEFFFDFKAHPEPGQFLLFGMSHWPNTRCQHCSWPLWKPTSAE